MNIRELMTTSLITTGPERPVLEARRLMNDKRIRHLLVTDGPKLLGIVTDRDSRLPLPSPATSLSVWEINYLIARMSVESVMTKSPIIVSPRQDAREAAVSAPGGRRRQPYRDHYRDRSPSRLRGENRVTATAG